MKVAVAYAEANQQVVLNMNVEEQMSVGDVIQKSGILSKFPHLDLSVNKIGIFSKIVPLDQPLSEGDRVEIYRAASGKPPKKERAPRGAAGAKTADAESDDSDDA